MNFFFFLIVQGLGLVLRRVINPSTLFIKTICVPQLFLSEQWQESFQNRFPVGTGSKLDCFLIGSWYFSTSFFGWIKRWQADHGVPEICWTKRHYDLGNFFSNSSVLRNKVYHYREGSLLVLKAKAYLKPIVLELLHLLEKTFCF